MLEKIIKITVFGLFTALLMSCQPMLVDPSPVKKSPPDGTVETGRGTPLPPKKHVPYIPTIKRFIDYEVSNSSRSEDYIISYSNTNGVQTVGPVTVSPGNSFSQRVWVPVGFEVMLKISKTPRESMQGEEARIKVNRVVRREEKSTGLQEFSIVHLVN